MPNPHGTPIWYELLTDDPDSAARFYAPVLGWSVEAQLAGEIDYRMIDSGQGLVGGVLRLTAEMEGSGARPGWMFYLGVDDADRTASALSTAGGRVLRAPWEIPGVGRMAVVADPDGAPFYIMRGASEGSSTAFDPQATGKCAWNELTAADLDGALGFYGPLFGWSFDERMPMGDMGDMGDYVFIDGAAGRIGAAMKRPQAEMPPHWRFYFRTADLESSLAAVRSGGGSVMLEPTPVPTGERIAIVGDPEGATFGLVAR